MLNHTERELLCIYSVKRVATSDAPTISTTRFPRFETGTPFTMATRFTLAMFALTHFFNYHSLITVLGILITNTPYH